MRMVLAGIAKLYHLPPSSRRAVLRALWITPTVSRSLHRQGYKKTVSSLEERSRPKLEREDSILAAKAADAAIRTIPWNMKCLERSLVVWWIVGSEAELRRGVSLGDDSQGHRFHAWVELDEVVLNDSPNVGMEFVPLDGRSMPIPDPSAFE